MALSYRDIRNNACKFIKEYTDAVKENAEAQSFLNEFFEVFGIKRRRVASFEVNVITDDKGIKRIDMLWPGKLLVEMKSTGQNLDKAYKQGVRYVTKLKDNDLPRYVMVCDLNDFRLYDLDDGKDYQFKLAELSDNLHLFDFMQGNEIEDINEYDLNEKATELLGSLHDALEESGYTDHQLQIFMVRILFILFAEDTGIFNRHQFTLYLMRFTDDSGRDTSMHLASLFQVLDEPAEKRSKNLPDELNAFPYVNGHLFKEPIKLPSFTQTMRDQLLQCCLFNWKDISPAIFGSLFQSIMDKKARHNLGAHYTSEISILRLIEPLFLNELKDEFNKADHLKQNKRRNDRLMALMNKIRSLRFLDPACGCGNFLIISYRELRRIELQIMLAQQKNQEYNQDQSLGFDIDPQINLDHFYGIEIDEWPACIAEVAMWLTQHQMNLEFAKEFGREPDLLPLREHANIHYANSLTIDWSNIVLPSELHYIIGNPPFIDRKERTPEQRELHEEILGKLKGFGNLDYVANWFYKAAKFTHNTTINCAFVSTNSIIMGEQVGTLWQPLQRLGVHINFAHRTFEWHNDAKGRAAVHCVIIGFSHKEQQRKFLFDYPTLKSDPITIETDTINPYLVNVPSISINKETKALNAPLPIQSGNMSNDGGYLILSEEEKEMLIMDHSLLKQWVRQYMGGKEFINGGKRYCLWLTDIDSKQLADLMRIPDIKSRIENVKRVRLSSKRKATNKLADTPWLFGEIRHPVSDGYIFIPQLSSERRTYIPLGFLSNEIIPTAPHFIIPDATLYEFGIITSLMHMDWMRTVSGKFKSDYRYSAQLVYNNFIWPNVSDHQHQKIKDLAQIVLDARQVETDKDATTTLADLYDPDLMPPALRKAHTTLDKAVDKLYRKEPFKTPLDRVKHLFELYEARLKV